jgi:phage shock protein C
MNRHFERHPEQGKVAGVCAGIAVYLDTDIALVRTAWILLSLVPGVLIGGVLAYAAAWVLMPVAAVPAPVTAGPRVTRPHIDRKIAGVCAGLARYFAVDPTLVRVIWVVLSIYPGFILLGGLAYVVAWFVIPSEPLPRMESAAQTS